jgi:hypothetical protein
VFVIKPQDDVSDRMMKEVFELAELFLKDENNWYNRTLYKRAYWALRPLWVEPVNLFRKKILIFLKKTIFKVS